MATSGDFNLAIDIDYDRCGILDATHLRFFTRRSFERLVRENGFVVVDCEAIGIPAEVLDRKAESFGDPESTSRGRDVLRSMFNTCEAATVRMRPNLFASQYAYKLAVQSTPPVSDGDAIYVCAESLPIGEQTPA